MSEVKTISEIIEDIIPHYKERSELKKKGLIEFVSETEHKLIYESYTETLEPVYYFIIDLMNDFGLKSEKLIDNFSSSEGSQNFSDQSMRKQAMQQQVKNTMEMVNTLTRSVLNIIHDLKDFKIRLQIYDDQKNKDTAEAARQSLKQIWLDKADILKGQGSIHQLTAGALQFATLRDAFLAAKDAKDAEKLDLNDRVKRVLIPRIHEFNIWVDNSEKELRKRYEIQRNYLKSQVSSLKLYSRWVRPYLKAAQKLEQKDMGRDPNLVTAFNRTILELTILGKSEIKVKEAALEGDLPRDLAKESFIKSLKRNYHKCILVDFNFLAVPQQGNLLGKAEITFRAYALNDDELKKINKEIDNSDLGNALNLIEGATSDSLVQMQEEIEMFLNEKDEEKKKEEKSRKNDINPFSALIGGYGKKSAKEDKKEDEDKPLKKDNWIESEHIRPFAIEGAKDTAFLLFDIYKKAHGMPSYT